MKNVYLRRGTYWFAKQIEGKRQWVNLQTSDFPEAARRALAIRDNPLLRPTGLIKEDAQRFTAWKLAQNEWSRQSSKTKVLAIEEFADLFPALAMHQVTTEHAETFYKVVRKRVTESTAQSYMMTLRSFFRWAMDVERVRLDNPVKAVKLARHDRKARKEFVEKELKNKLIAEATNDDLRFILFCGFDAGLRKNEISEARVDWFTKDGLHVRKAETGSARLRPDELEFRPKDRDERVIPLTKPFREFLVGYLKDKEPLDFALKPKVKHGSWRYRYDIRRPLTDYMLFKQVPWVTAHVMRHSFASILATAGVSIFKISEWLGDDVRVTQRNYAKLSPGDEDIHELS